MKSSDLLKFVLLLFCISLAACDNKLNPGFDQNDYEPIVPPDPVYTLNSMSSGERVILNNGSLTNIVLSWTPTTEHGNTLYRYEVLFEGPDGDFSDPIQIFTSDNNGTEPQLTLSHYQANVLGHLANFKANSNGTLRWKIKAYCGLDESISSLEGYFVVFLMDGIDNIPLDNDPVFITGQATEDEGDESSAMQMLFRGNGNYEVFTQLQADKPFVFMSMIDNQKYYYYANINGKLREITDESDATLVSGSGIYRITVNFANQTFVADLIGDVYLFNLSGQYRQDLSYQGNGKWGITNYTARKQREGWASGGETRYSYKMEINGNTVRWGNKDKDASQPSSSTPLSYYNLYELSPGTDAWDFSFRYSDDLLHWGPEQNGKFYATVKTDVTLYFNTEYGLYTSRWTQSNNN